MSEHGLYHYDHIHHEKKLMALKQVAKPVTKDHLSHQQCIAFHCIASTMTVTMMISRGASFAEAQAKGSGKIIVKIDDDGNMSNYLMVAMSPKHEPKAAAMLLSR